MTGDRALFVSWDPPSPRTGLLGSWDRLVGPHALRSENWLIVVGSLVVTALAIGRLLEGSDRDLAIWEVLLVAALAFDIAGGVVANATGTAKRWYHRPGREARHHLGFLAAHAGHVALIAWLFAAEPVWLFVAGYGGLLVSGAAVVSVPHHLERPVAMGAVAVGTLVATFEVMAIPGVEWFIPLLYLKLVAGHLVVEAPFLPEGPRA